MSTERSVYVRLSMLMFLQYAISGAFRPVFSNYLESSPAVGGKGFDAWQIGLLFSLGPMATVLTPLLAGYLADRHIALQRLLQVIPLICCLCLLGMIGAHAFVPFFVATALYALVHTPTGGLTNAISFVHLSDRRRFGIVRVWGTVGWITAGIALFAWRNSPRLTVANDLLWLATGLCLAQSCFALCLPATPPNRHKSARQGLREAAQLFRQKHFLVFIAVMMAASMEFDFCYILTGPFLKHHLGVRHENVSALMTMNQLVEIPSLFLLPLIVRRMGIRRTMIMGLLAWALRWTVYAVGRPHALVLTAMSMHGFGFACVFVVGSIYIDQAAPRHLRASAQTLLAMLTYGVGCILGSNLVGVLKTWLRTGDQVCWAGLFSVPAVVMLLSAGCLWLWFEDRVGSHPSTDTHEPGLVDPTVV